MMIRNEPTISVGVMEGVTEVHGQFHGSFRTSDGRDLQGAFTVVGSADGLRISCPDSHAPYIGGSELVCSPVHGGDFLLRDVVIGIQFHWERKEDQRFEGSLRIVRRPTGTLTVINIVSLEQYLRSVISSEMSGASPTELLRAHAITSRSWLGAMLERKQRARGIVLPPPPLSGEIIRWYTREDHDIYDVCADDHCQRYQGITKILSPVAGEAVDATRGKFLVYDGAICDARYYKACGGITEEYRSAWEDRSIPYLTSVSDGPTGFAPVKSEDDARRWIASTPGAYCNTHDPELLRQILPSFDQETVDFFRWEVGYRRTELEEILRDRSGIDFGTLQTLVPLERGPSGRIVRMRIEGSERTMVVGKELEIRRWLSRTHLYSSAFVVTLEGQDGGGPERIRLRGAGWGHGVGLCQIGAAVMAAKGFSAEEIVLHYFPGAAMETLY